MAGGHDVHSIEVNARYQPLESKALKPIHEVNVEVKSKYKQRSTAGDRVWSWNGRFGQVVSVGTATTSSLDCVSWLLAPTALRSLSSSAWCARKP